MKQRLAVKPLVTTLISGKLITDEIIDELNAKIQDKPMYARVVIPASGCTYCDAVLMVKKYFQGVEKKDEHVKEFHSGKLLTIFRGYIDKQRSLLDPYATESRRFTFAQMLYI